MLKSKQCKEKFEKKQMNDELFIKWLMSVVRDDNKSVTNFANVK